MDSARTIITWHDESVNVWTHSIAAVFFASSAVALAIRQTGHFPSTTGPILLYQMTVTLCFAFSALYHLFANHASARLWHQLDHSGIVLVIWGSSISFISLSFEFEHQRRCTYTALVTASAVLSLIHLAQGHLQSPRSRIASHIVLGVWAGLPAVDFLFRSPFHALPPDFDFFVRSFCFSVLMNSLGGAICAAGIFTTKSRTIQNVSHNAMHLFAVDGAWAYQRGLYSVHRARMGARS